MSSQNCMPQTFSSKCYSSERLAIKSRQVNRCCYIYFFYITKRSFNIQIRVVSLIYKYGYQSLNEKKFVFYNQFKLFWSAFFSSSWSLLYKFYIHILHPKKFRPREYKRKRFYSPKISFWLILVRDPNSESVSFLDKCLLFIPKAG